MYMVNEFVQELVDFGKPALDIGGFIDLVQNAASGVMTLAIEAKDLVEKLQGETGFFEFDYSDCLGLVWRLVGIGRVILNDKEVAGVFEQ